MTESADPGLVRHRLGRTAVEVTELGFGAAPIANLYAAVDPEVAAEAVRVAWTLGIRYFDAAPHYGLGLAERRLGAVLAEFPRSEFTVSTKVGRLLVPNANPSGSDLGAGGFDVPDDFTRIRDYSADGVRRSLEQSLARLGLDRIDVVYVHDPEDAMDQAIDEAIPALTALRDQGVIGAVGAGMNFVEPLRRIVAEADVDVIMVAGRWTLLDRSAAELIQECAERSVSVVAAAPFNSGLLARPVVDPGATFDYGPAAAEQIELARSLAAVCGGYDVELPQAALRSPLRAAAVVSVVAGLADAGQVRAAVERMEAPVPSELWPHLDAVVNG